MCVRFYYLLQIYSIPILKKCFCFNKKGVAVSEVETRFIIFSYLNFRKVSVTFLFTNVKYLKKKLIPFAIVVASGVKENKTQTHFSTNKCYMM